jgi:ABC-2 type transport system permease protein
MGPSLLHYRTWRGQFHGPGWSPWPIARVALDMMFRRKLFWALYGFALLTFLLFFFGQYLLAWAEAQAGESTVSVLGVKRNPAEWIALIRGQLRLNGTGETYRNFFWYQGYMVMVVLALAGALLVGNDFQFGSLPFYLAKPLAPWHYVLGKCLAVAFFINLMTTVPAVVLYVQYRTLYSWGNVQDELGLLGGILVYGLVLTVFLSLMLVATASWLRRTVPLIMAWTTMFFFMRLLGSALVDGLRYDPRWRLIDLWNDTYLVGNFCLGLSPPRQPAWYEAALVLGVMCLLCVNYLNRRIRAVEIVQ